MARAVGLDTNTIALAGLSVADAHGLDGLSMRRVAGVLGVTPMALYHHVEDKEGLLDLMVDQSLTAIPVIEDDVREFFLALHRLLVAHPALAHAMATRPLEGPVATAAAEQAVAALRRSGLDDDQAVDTFVSLFSHTLGASLYRISRTDQRTPRRFPGIDPDTAPALHQSRRRLTAGAADDQRLRHALDTLLADEPRN